MIRRMRSIEPTFVIRDARMIWIILSWHQADARLVAFDLAVAGQLRERAVQGLVRKPELCGKIPERSR